MYPTILHVLVLKMNRTSNFSEFHLSEGNEHFNASFLYVLLNTNRICITSETNTENNE